MCFLALSSDLLPPNKSVIPFIIGRSRAPRGLAPGTIMERIKFTPNRPRIVLLAVLIRNLCSKVMAMRRSILATCTMAAMMKAAMQIKYALDVNPRTAMGNFSTAPLKTSNMGMATPVMPIGIASDTQMTHAQTTTASVDLPA